MPGGITKKTIAVGVTAVLALAVGIALPYLTKSILSSEIGKVLPLQNGSEVFNSWVDPHHDAAEHIQFWIFDVANAEEIVENGDKPIVSQKGPFTYTQFSLKTNISFDSQSDDTIEYRQEGTYFFDESMSAYSEDLMVTTVNFPVYVVEYMFRNQALPEELLDIVVRVIENEHMFIRVSVRELLWGYEDKFLGDMLRVLQLPSVARIIKEFNVTIPQLDSHFGLYYNRNGSNNGIFKVFQGHKDISTFLTVQSWNGQKHLNYWRDDYCNMINGTDGSEFPPFLEKDSVRYMFSTDLCRSVPLVYYDEVSVQGIPAYEIRLPVDVFSYQPTSHENTCFCSTDDSCPLDGALDLGLCSQGAPVFVSQPHFLHGSDDYIHGVLGLHPVEDEHALHLYVEPNTGVVLDCMIRFQLNLKLTNISAIKEARNLPGMLMFPLIWFNASAVVTQARIDEFKSEFVTFLQVAAVLPYVFIGLGALLALTFLFCAGRQYRKVKMIKDDRWAVSEVPDENSRLLANGVHKIEKSCDEIVRDPADPES